MLLDELSQGLEVLGVEFGAGSVLSWVRGDASGGGVVLDEFAYEVAADPEAFGEGAVPAFLLGVGVDDFLSEVVGVRGGHT